jgi:diadenosine tetraphosphate (Ap4A) HIT family hydrolase
MEAQSPAGRAHRIRPGHPDRLTAARAGEDPAVIAKLRSGYVALNETQFLPGYCLLIADADGAEHLTDLPRPARERFLADLGLLGEALMAACAAWDPAFTRLDYEIVGNGERRLEAHVVARYAWEPVELRDGPVWRHPPSRWRDPACALGPAHERLVEAITRELGRALAEAYGPPASD